MSDGVVIVYERGALRVATFGPICMTSIGGPITSELIREAHGAGAALARRVGGRIGALDVIAAGVPLPDAELRAEASALARAAEDRVVAGAYVVLGEGFGASAVRSVLTAMTVLGRGAPRKTFSQPTAAVDWLAERVGLPARELAPIARWCDQASRPGP